MTNGGTEEKGEGGTDDIRQPYIDGGERVRGEGERGTRREERKQESCRQ